MEKLSRRGFRVRALGLLFPTAVTILVGVGLIWTSFVSYLVVSLAAELLIAIGLTIFLIGRKLLSKERQSTRVPRGHVDPRWIRMESIYALLAILDLLLVLFFFELSSHSDLTQTVSLYLMAIFLPITYLGSFTFRDAYLSLLDHRFSYQLDKPSTIVWETSSIARSLLNQRTERGILYLRKSLEASRSLLESVGRVSEPLDDVISFLDLAWETGIQIDYDALIAFTDKVFGGDSPNLELLHDESEHLIRTHPWFSKTRKPVEKNPSRGTLAETIARTIGKILGGAGVIGGLTIVSQMLGQSLSSVGKGFEADLPVIALIATGLGISYFPALGLKKLLGAYVPQSDLDEYEKGMVTHPRSEGTFLLSVVPETGTAKQRSSVHRLQERLQGARRWAERNPRIILTSLVVLLMALTAVTGFIPWSGVPAPIPVLRVTILPPGYPVAGESWSVQVWQHTYPSQPWTQAANSTLLMVTTDGNFSYPVVRGQVSVQYAPALGNVKFVAEKPGFESAEWRPQTSFVPSEVAYALLGFYLLGGGISVYQVSFEVNKKHTRSGPLRILSFVTIISVGLGYVLTVLWLQRWNLGTAWGFGNDIATGVEFYPHLFFLTIANVLLSFALIRVSARKTNPQQVLAPRNRGFT
ncbi:MAG: hypothetical protein ABSB29_05160 [Nitrososphaerales archaeon]|jgi:hypothetical protein